MTDSVVGEESSIEEILRIQRRARRTWFWGCFAAIAFIGGAWAWLSKEPIDPFFFDEVDDMADIAVPDGIEPIPATTTAPFQPTTTEGFGSTTTGPPTTTDPFQSTNTGPLAPLPSSTTEAE